MTTSTLGDIGLNINNALVTVTYALEAFSYVAALFFVILGILKFKEHTENPRNTSLSTPIVIMTCACMFMYVPAVLKTLGETMFTGQKGLEAPTYKNKDHYAQVIT